MKHHAIETIKTFCEKLFDDDFRNYETPRIEVGSTADGGYRIEVAQMYEYVHFDTEKLFKMCEFFDTMAIDEDRYSSGGCETCDYGSSYEITFSVKDGKPFPISEGGV